MFWNIPYNKWHAILAFILTSIVFPFANKLITKSFNFFQDTFLQFSGSILLTLFVVFTVHAYHEYIQAISLKTVDIYFGDWKQFIDDTRKDWFYVFIGCGLVLDILILTFGVYWFCF